MKALSILAFLFCSFVSFGQVTSDAKPTNSDTKETDKEKFSKENLLTEYAAKSCQCIDSISVKNKNEKEKASEVKSCIDKEVISYQVYLKVGELSDELEDVFINGEEGESFSMRIENNPNSEEYKMRYFEIERKLMNSCPSIKMVTGMK